MKKHVQPKYYKFLVKSYEDDNSHQCWIKKISLTDPDGNELRSEISTIAKHYPQYLCMMQFENDELAIEWFDSHYKGF